MSLDRRNTESEIQPDFELVLQGLWETLVAEVDQLQSEHKKHEQYARTILRRVLQRVLGDLAR